MAHEAGVSVAKSSSSLRFEFDGNEPESSVLLTTIAPLVSWPRHIVWSGRPTHRVSVRGRILDSCFQIVQQPGNVDHVRASPCCRRARMASCQFTSLPNTGRAQLD